MTVNKIGTINVRKVQLLHLLKFDVMVTSKVISMQLVFSEMPRNGYNQARDMLNSAFLPYFFEWVDGLKAQGDVRAADINDFRAATGAFFAELSDMSGWQFADLMIGEKPLAADDLREIIFDQLELDLGAA